MTSSAKLMKHIYYYCILIQVYKSELTFGITNFLYKASLPTSTGIKVCHIYVISSKNFTPQFWNSPILFPQKSLMRNVDTYKINYCQLSHPHLRWFTQQLHAAQDMISGVSGRKTDRGFPPYLRQNIRIAFTKQTKNRSDDLYSSDTGENLEYNWSEYNLFIDLNL